MAPRYRPELLQITRKRFSTTQGEVLLTYDGQRVNQYGDTITLSEDGQYRGHDDKYWHDVARRWLRREGPRQPINDATKLLRKLVAWESHAFDNDEEINGGDAVEFLAEIRKSAKAIIAKGQ